MTNTYTQMIEDADNALKEANAKAKAARRAKDRAREASMGVALRDLGRAVALQHGIDVDTSSAELEENLGRITALIEDTAAANVSTYSAAIEHEEGTDI